MERVTLFTIVYDEFRAKEKIPKRLMNTETILIGSGRRKLSRC